MKAMHYAGAWLLGMLTLQPLVTRAQEPGVDPAPKVFETPKKAGEVQLIGIREKLVNGRPCIIYEALVPVAGAYVLQALGNFSRSEKVYVTSAPGGAIPPDLDPAIARYSLQVTQDGWQAARAYSSQTGENRVPLSPGRTDIYLFTKATVFPLSDRISASQSGVDPDFDQNVINVMDMVSQQTPSYSNPVKDGQAGTKIIPNPLGNYSHQVNEWFSYTTRALLYLTAGTTVIFQTNTAPCNDPVLHLFSDANPDAFSWSHDDIMAPPCIWDARLIVTIPVTGYYRLLVRPYYDNQKFNTNITLNGAPYINNTPVGGRRFDHAGYNGNRNFFTAYMTGDTWLYTLNGPAGHVRGQRDDYSWGGGNWLRSRVKKNFPTTIYTTFVTSYSTASIGICDTYMGNLNGTIHGPGGPFPALLADDCIQSAPGSPIYNCISWSGGITANWQWPPTDGNYFIPGVTPDPERNAFDRYYSNVGNAGPRYVGAWDYNRGEATVGNSVIDLWKIGTGVGNYTHASVKKPGNNNPHGYDWESKPGQLERTFHPRNALNGAAYGAVSDYYVFAGTISRNAAGQPATKDIIATDADAVRLGYSVYDDARLTDKAQQKLTTLLAATNSGLANNFARLYDAWVATWIDKPEISSPEVVTLCPEYDALLAFSKNAGPAVLPLVFNRYLSGHFLASRYLWTLTTPTYEHLLVEVGQDLAANRNDRQGRQVIRNTFGNNIYYIEKMLNALPLPAAAPEARFTSSVSPNPFKDRLNIEVTLTAESKVSITAASAQTGGRVTVLRETTLPAGTHRYTANARQFAGSIGDIISVQVQVNGITQTIKAIAGQ